MKKALISGITGQDGSYLTELLIQKGYEVHGIIRRASSFNTGRIDHLYQDQLEGNPQMILHYGDLTDSSNLNRIIEKVEPVEIYNLAAQSHVQVSFEVPEYTAECDAIGTLRLLDAIRETGSDARFYQASTSELYGKVQEVPQTETTPFYPRSPYGVAKQYGYWIVKNYRESYGLHASNGILFNHESPRRGETFVTRKITMAVARISRGLQKCLYMGNIEALRDWGYAPDYVEMMWLMLQQDHPDDYVVATNEMHSVRSFIEKSFSYVDIKIEWEGEGVNEVGRNSKTGDIIIRMDKRYYRPCEVDQLLGNPEKAKRKLGWEPKVKFEELVKIMTEGDLRLLDNPTYEVGFKVELDSKIYIAGHSGLVGSAIWRALEKKGYTHLIGRRSSELDLINQQAVNNFFEAEKPDYVVLVAAKVGGIHANNTYRAQFIYENLMIEANVIHAAYTTGVKKLLYLGSSCIYPKDAEQPMVEEALLTAPLEPTNEPYAIAKIAGIRLCDAYNRQYGTNFYCRHAH